ncbi:extracellular solute-binding protein [Rhodovulum sp. DZ06]|uniref:extracellular solute-binding protein n=1 Tax=Rhodovulum sp. DZ06 TaxID=3425126 RepID=UPI003D34AC19
MHGAPALPEGFAHLPYADPDSPKGGRLTLGEVGGFDSLNPWIVKGRAPWAIRSLSFETLLGRNWDEPFALYGLLAETVETPEDRTWVEFKLRPEARFSDGSPVTAEDVIWSMEVLAEKGLPGFRSSWKKVAKAEDLGGGRIRFTFNAPDREMPLILGLRPIMQKAWFEGRDFGDTILEPMVTSGPYIAADLEPGRYVTFRKNPDWWGADLPFNAGRWNFEEIRHEWYKDAAGVWEAFKAGQVDMFRDGDPGRWQDGYDFAAARDGRVRKAEIPHGRPSGMTGFVFNMRRAPFDDRRVRLALAHAFDFEWINKTMNRGGYARIESFFGGSPLGHAGKAEGREREILAPFAAELPEGALEAAMEWPASDGSGRNRRNLRKAKKLLESAGFKVVDGVLTSAEGEPFRFEILLGGGAWEAAAATFVDGLRPLGIEARIRTVDSAQFQARVNEYDYDMVVRTWAMSLSPGNEQRFYWDGAGRTQPGTRNYAGIDSPAVDAAIDALLAAREREGFEAAARALDRALTWEVQAIPLWHAPASRIAVWEGYSWPEKLPLYGDWTGWLPDVWRAAPAE